MNRFTLSCYKSISYRLFSIASIFLIGYLITDDWMVAGSIAVVDQVFKTVFYFFHEGFWERYYKKQKVKK